MHVLLPLAVLAFVFLVGCGRNDKTMTWSDSRDPVAITTVSVASKAKPVLLVIHQDGHGGWQFMDGGDVTATKPHVIPKDELLKLDPTLKEVTDLPVDWEARRSSASSPWVRTKR